VAFALSQRARFSTGWQAKNMVGRILRRHGIVEKEGGGYSLIGFDDLDDEQVEHLIELCEAKRPRQ
jgi:hypothetical protein